jgi:DNA-binding NarL/FixJ family response regulator
MKKKRGLKSHPYTKEQKVRVLQLLSDGKAQKEIAAEISIPHRSVEHILSQLRKEMNCTNNERMIKLATQTGIII